MDLMDVGDHDGAIRVLQAPAQAGIGYAWFCLAIANMKKGSVDEAITWYEKAAADGNVDAMAYLGYVYKLKGDRVTARQWLTRAAANGNQNAATMLTTLDLGNGNRGAAVAGAGSKLMGDNAAAIGNLGMAIQSWTAAADAGDGDAMYKIGRAKYQQGIRGEAILWLERASRAGNTDADEFRREILS